MNYRYFTNRRGRAHKVKRKRFPLIPLPLIFIEEVKEDLSFLSDFSLLALIRQKLPIVPSWLVTFFADEISTQPLYASVLSSKWPIILAPTSEHLSRITGANINQTAAEQSACVKGTTPSPTRRLCSHQGTPEAGFIYRKSHFWFGVPLTSDSFSSAFNRHECHLEKSL